jgi:hypothetical protein
MSDAYKDSWDETTDALAWLDKDAPWSFGDLVVKPAAASAYAAQLFASQSLSTLIISTKQSWPERMMAAHIRVHPRLGNEVVIEMFEQSSDRSGGACVKSIGSTTQDAWPQLEPLLQELANSINDRPKEVALLCQT